MCNEGLATTQCLICRRVGISAADRTRSHQRSAALNHHHRHLARRACTGTSLRLYANFRHLRPCTSIRGCRFGSRISSMPTSTSTSMSISQFLALRVSGLQGLQVGSGQGDRISGVLDQHPDLAVGVVVGVAVGDARSSGTSARSVTRQQRAVMRSESAHVHDPLNSLSAQRGSASPPANSVDLKWNNTGGRGRYRTAGPLAL